MVFPNLENLRIKYNYSTELLIEIEMFARQNFDFITKIHGEKHLKQELALKLLLDDITKELGYGGAAGGAKSWTGCTWQLLMCLAYPGVKGVIAREELKDLRMSTYKTFSKVTLEYFAVFNQYWTFDGKDCIIKFSNGSTIDLIAIKQEPSDPEYQWLGSLEYTFGWIEEAGEAKTNMGFEVLKTRIGRHMNDVYGIIAKMLVTFNPKKNYVYSYFHIREKNGTLPETVKFIRALLYDNPHRESGYEAQLQGMNIQAQKERLLLGNFDYDDDPSALCDYDAISDMFRNEHLATPDYKKKGMNRITKYGSADLAMKGRDNFVAGHWDGLIGYVDIIKPKSDGREIETDIRKLMIKWQIPHSRFVVDSTGMGSYLESYIKGIKEFNFAESAVHNDKFVKLKDECAFKLAELINDRKIWIICSQEVEELIKQEVGVLRQDEIDNDTRKKKIISKEDMKGLIGRSPDYLDWLILRMYFEVVKEAKTGVYRRSENDAKESIYPQTVARSRQQNQNTRGKR